MSAYNPGMTQTYSVFAGTERLVRGDLAQAARATKQAFDEGRAQLVVLDDLKGTTVELDLRGTVDDVLARLPRPSEAETRPGRGRPRLGVTAREVTLLPRHWDWLATQPGGASATLRRLIEAARRDGATQETEVRDRFYRVMSLLAGNLPEFEEASRALFAGNRARLEEAMASWPEDVRAYLTDLT